MSSSSPRELPGDASASRLAERIPAIRDDEKAGKGAPADESAQSAGSRQAERRERQRQEARRTILDATESLVIEKNGSDFSIRELGKRAGYSAPTVYHYFGDKDGLIEALLEERVSRLAS